MILFAEYNGPDFGKGRFIKGKVYLADVASEGGVEYSRNIALVDEDGERIRLDYKDARFSCFSDCLAVVVEPMRGRDLEVGDVVSCSKASKGENFKIEVQGTYWNMSRLILLDRLIVQPGRKVLWNSNWYSIGGVGDDMNVLLDGEWRPLQECRFFVVCGRIGASPMVRCKSAVGLTSISLGALYEVLGESGNLYMIKGDDGEMCGFDQSRFEKIFFEK